MVVISATGAILALKINSIFMLSIAVLSFYLTYSGYRALGRKRSRKGSWFNSLDWAVTLLALAFGLGLIVRGFGDFLSLLFGMLTCSLSVITLRHLNGKRKKHDWLYDHVTGMCGSYIATFTAFALVNMRFLPPVLVWILPMVVGTIGITLTNTFYRKRLARGQQLDQLLTVGGAEKECVTTLTKSGLSKASAVFSNVEPSNVQVGDQSRQSKRQ
jgi:hypothetical protein